MRKLIRLFGLFVIICLIYGLGSAFNGSESTENIDDPNELSTEIIENNNFENYIPEENIVEKDNSQVHKQNEETIYQNEDKEGIEDKKENKIPNEKLSLSESKEEKLEENKEDKIKENNEIIKNHEVEEVIDNSNNNVDNSSNDIKKNDDVIIDEKIEEDIEIDESSTEDNVLKIDEEYERLKKLYKYKSASECYYASLKVYSQTYQENYKNANCISGAYNGELLGYRIIIYFNDGTSMYYDEAI